MTDKIEEMIKAKGLTAARITPERIDEIIKEVIYWQPEGTTVTVALLTVENGSHFIGESACVSPANFDSDIGKVIAYANAKSKIWSHEGYLLKQEIHNLYPDF